MDIKKTDLEIKYKEYLNHKNRETIVILHGWGGSSDSWIDVAEALNESGFNVLVPDLPGFGETKLNYIFDLDEYAKVVSSFLKELKIDNFILWGHSNGGAISIKIANSNIFNIKTLILNNSAGIRNDKKRTIKRKILNSFCKIIKTIIHFIPSPLRKRLEGNSILNKIREMFYKLIGSHDYINSEKNPFLKETYKNMISSDLSEEIKKIELNTLLIWGENDTYTPVSDGHFMRNNIKKSKLVILDGETHGIHIRNPYRLVETFLNNI